MFSIRRLLSEHKWSDGTTAAAAAGATAGPGMMQSDQELFHQSNRAFIALIFLADSFNSSAAAATSAAATSASAYQMKVSRTTATSGDGDGDGSDDDASCLNIVLTYV